MRIYAIVITYNGEKWIDTCFGSLRHSDLKVHTIAIDNASTDQTVNILKSKYPEVEVIENKKNIGFGRANNIGLQRALDDNADYVLLLNQDAWVEPNTIKGLVNTQLANSEYDILSPLHFDIEKEELIDPHCAMDMGLELVSDALLSKDLKKAYRIDKIHAAIWFMTVKCIKEIGGFDPIFFYRSEDVDYVIRVNAAGLQFGITPYYKAYHRGDMARVDKLTRKKKMNILLNKQLLYFKKHLDEPFIKLVYLSMNELFFELLKNIFRLKIQNSFMFLILIFKTISLLPNIYRSRNSTRNKSCPFLNRIQ